MFFCLNVPWLIRLHCVRRLNNKPIKARKRMPTLLQLCPLRLVFDAINAIERCFRCFEGVWKKKIKKTKMVSSSICFCCLCCSIKWLVRRTLCDVLTARLSPRGLSAYATLCFARRLIKKKPTRDFILKWVMGLAITRSRNHPSRRHRNRRRSLHPQESNS